MVGVAVKAPVVDVKYTGTEVGHMYLCDAHQLLGDRSVGVLDVG